MHQISLMRDISSKMAALERHRRVQRVHERVYEEIIGPEAHREVENPPDWVLEPLQTPHVGQRGKQPLLQTDADGLVAKLSPAYLCMVSCGLAKI